LIFNVLSHTGCCALRCGAVRRRAEPHRAAFGVNERRQRWRECGVELRCRRSVAAVVRINGQHHRETLTYDAAAAARRNVVIFGAMSAVRCGAARSPSARKPHACTGHSDMSGATMSPPRKWPPTGRRPRRRRWAATCGPRTAPHRAATCLLYGRVASGTEHGTARRASSSMQ